MKNKQKLNDAATEATNNMNNRIFLKYATNKKDQKGFFKTMTSDPNTRNMFIDSIPDNWVKSSIDPRPTTLEYSKAKISEKEAEDINNIVNGSDGKPLSPEFTYNPKSGTRNVTYNPDVRWRGFTTEDYNANTNYVRKRFGLNDYPSDLKPKYTIPVFRNPNEFYNYRPLVSTLYYKGMKEPMKTNRYLAEDFPVIGSHYFRKNNDLIEPHIGILDRSNINNSKRYMHYNHYMPSFVRHITGKNQYNQYADENVALAHEFIHAISDPAFSNSQDVMTAMWKKYPGLKEKILNDKKYGYFAKEAELLRALRGAKMTALSIWPLNSKERKPENFQNAITLRMNRIHNLTEANKNALLKSGRIKPADLDVLFRVQDFFRNLNNNGKGKTTDEFEFIRSKLAPVAQNSRYNNNEKFANTTNLPFIRKFANAATEAAKQLQSEQEVAEFNDPILDSKKAPTQEPNSWVLNAMKNLKKQEGWNKIPKDNVNNKTLRHL